MRYNLYKRKKDNIYEYVECKISDTKFDDYKELWSNFNDGDYIVDISNDNLAFPILIGGKLREMTREEKIILLGDAILLKDGEYVEDGHIIQVPNPSTKYLKYDWNKETLEWELITTKEELVRIRSEKVKKVHELRNDIITFTKFGGCEDEIELAQKEIDRLIPEINELAKLIQEVKIHEQSEQTNN